MRMYRANYRILLVGLMVVMASVSAIAVAETDFDEIVFFGDSLSDSGNAFVLLGEVSVRPFEPIPTFPYARGGKHFSNGPTWTEQLARSLRMNKSAKPALRVPGVFTNYAFGSGRARIEGSVHLTAQVGLFAQDYPLGIDNALYSIVIGGNDVRDALVAYATDTSGATSVQIIADAVAAIATNITELASMGADQFIVGYVPNVGLAPAVRAGGPLVELLATSLSVGFNNALAPTLSALEAGLGISIARMDLFGTITDAVKYPETVGLTEVVAPCLTFYVRARAFCSQPDDYLFWDGIHPTRAGHGVLAAEAASVLN